MARGINKVILVGAVGKDPENKSMPSGDAIAHISIATNEQWQDRATGEKKENTEWHRVVFFGRLAETVGMYVRKGQMIYVEGRLKTRKWQGQDGQDRYTTEIIASDMQMIGGRPNEGDRAPMNQGGYGSSPAPAPRSNNNYSNNTNSQPASDYAAPSSGRNNFEDFDDDIPF
ncbi:single-stranded DNA-binding protein [Thiofilum flexile]|uniref:single-stranded DNA-binding protein n=1 Tax=Thiofilum flexile TaxID=125627 RepID=UPI000377E142|nr:single-stranded DNA-binding protein [Thiofilum flexile]